MSNEPTCPICGMRSNHGYKSCPKCGSELITPVEYPNDMELFEKIKDITLGCPMLKK